MSGAPNYGPGDLIAALEDSTRNPIRKGQVFVCEGLRPPAPGHHIWGVWIGGLRARAELGTRGAFKASAFVKVDPLPPAMFKTDVDVNALLEETV